MKNDAKKNTIEITREQIIEKQRIEDEITAIQQKISSPSILSLESKKIASATASNKFRNFIEYHGKGSEEKVPLVNQMEMNRLKQEAESLRQQLDPILKEKEHLLKSLSNLNEQLAMVSMPISLAVIITQQDEIANEQENLSSLEHALQEHQGKLSEILDSTNEDLNILHNDLLAEKAMGKDVSAELEASERAIADQGERANTAEVEAHEISRTISGLTKKIEEARRHLNYLERDKNEMVLQFLKMESETTEGEYVKAVNSLVESYCKLRSLDTIIGQVSNNHEAPFITGNAYNFNIPAIGPNASANDFLFTASQFEQFGDCLSNEKARLSKAGIQL